MKQNIITKKRFSVWWLISATSLCLLALILWFGYFNPTPVFHTTTEEEANQGWEGSADDSDPFLNDLFIKRFGWHSLPAHSVQHVWGAGLTHHAERYVIRLSPAEFADLKAHVDLAVKAHPQEPYGRPSLGPNPFAGDRFKWWNPPHKNAFSFSIGFGDENQPNEVIGDYILEYDPETQLLYIDAITV